MLLAQLASAIIRSLMPFFRCGDYLSFGIVIYRKYATSILVRNFPVRPFHNAYHKSILQRDPGGQAAYAQSVLECDPGGCAVILTGVLECDPGGFFAYANNGFFRGAAAARFGIFAVRCAYANAIAIATTVFSHIVSASAQMVNAPRGHFVLPEFAYAQGVLAG